MMFWVLILGCATPPSPDHVDRSATGPDSASTPSTDPLGSTPPAGTTPTTGSTPTVSTPTGGTDTSSTDPGPAGIAVCVNELMARNQVSTASGEDWVELFAPGDAVSLDGWWISDDPDRPLAVPLAGLEVPAGGALVLEAERELSFGLSGDGDAVVLTDPWGHTDTVRFGETGSDQAWTRTADCCAGADCWSPVHGGTPGRSNVVVTEDVTLVAPGSIWKVYTDEPAREWLNPGWLDGTGTIHRLSRDEDAERVQAAAVSMGLLGIVVEVTFQCEPRYDVIGVEHTLPFDEVPFDLFGTGPGSLEAFLRDSEYSRIEWWPQAGVNRLVIWNARRMQAHDYTAETGPFGALKARTFETFDEIGSPAMTQAIGGAILAGISRWRPQLQGLFGAQRGRYASFLGQRFITGQVKRLLYEQFVPVQTDAPEFWDSWHEALPMDHTIDDRFMPVTFAELWLPLSETGRVMRRLERHFAEFGTRACGYMPFEIYAAGPSDLWLHPGHERPESLRLNFFWFNGTAGDPREFLQPFWDMVSDLGVRPHWGKLLPADPSWVQTHIKPNIPRWDDFVALRRQMDPDGLFLTAYWQSIFGDGASIADTPVAPSVTPASPLDLTFGERRRWPMLYTLAPSTLDDVDELPGQLYRDGHAEAQPEVLWPLIADFQRRGEWMRLLGHVELLTEDWAADDAAVVQTFAPLISVRARTIAREAPHLWAAAIDRASLPLVRRAAERFELTPDGRGGTHLRWTLAYELSDTALARRAPALLQRWFAASFEALLRLAAAHT
jgi:FAD/FMN-containing dehydrogenase